MSYTPKYIATTDLTDSIAKDFIAGSDARVDIWMANTDLEIETIGMMNGVQPTSIYEPVNYKIKEYAVCYFYFLLFQNCYGENTVEVDERDAYKMKLDWYKERCNELRPGLTKELFQQVYTSVAPAGFVSTGLIYRS